MKTTRPLLAALGALGILFAHPSRGQLFQHAGPISVSSLDDLKFTAKILSTPTVPEPYTFTTLAGLPRNQGHADGTGIGARFNAPYGVAVDSAGNIYVADTRNETIRKVTAAGAVTTLAGWAGSSGSADGTGSAARFNAPYAVGVDSAGNVYVADRGNSTIRKVTPTGVVTTLAGLAGSVGSADGSGSAARFNQPWGVAVDSVGNVYVADLVNHMIRKVTPTGVVTTLAGLADSFGSEDGTGNAARFNQPSGVAVDSAGNVYVADEGNHTIRKVTPAGVVTTLAGLAGHPGSADGVGSAAQFWNPYGVAVDRKGNILVADTWNETFRKMTAAGEVTTPAGLAGTFGSADGTGSAARFDHPTGVAVDSAGNVYVADSINNTIRKGVPSVVAPSIISEPKSQTNTVGTTVTFTVLAIGSAPLTYQWKFKGVNIAGATSSVLPLTNVQKVNEGAYTVVVSNAAGTATSQQAQLKVITSNSPPTISNIPDQRTDRNIPTPPIPFTVGDTETPVENLDLSAASSDETLVPNGNILFGGTPQNRALIVLPAQNQSGRTTITLTVTDADGGSASSRFLLTIGSPNSPPTLNAMSNLTILEDAPVQTANLTGITSGAPIENQVLTVTATSSNPGLIPNPTVKYTSPNSTGPVSLQPAPDANGQATISVIVRDNGGTANGGIDAVMKTFLVTVTSVNDPPSFTKGSDQIVNEDSGAQTVIGWAALRNQGPPDESSQTVSFQVVSDNNALFSVQPAIPANGTLSFAPSANANGSATVTVILKDNGGTANGGVDSSSPQTFKITVASVNDAPTLALINNVTFNEDFLDGAIGAPSINLAGIGAGGGENQTLTVTATSSNPFFLQNPFVTYATPATTARLTFVALQDNVPGSATVTVVVTDDGGTANGGVNAVTNNFVFTINPVNDAPSFTRGADLIVAEDSGAQTIPNWATNAGPGRPDEANQTLAFQVTNDNAALFSVPPAISPNGALAFTPASDGHGLANVTVTLKDNGGIANGGVDASPPETFKITVAPVNDPPALDPIGNVTINENAPQQIVNLTGISAGPPNEKQNTIVTATSDKPLLIADPTVNYTSPNTAGTLTFRPLPKASGIAIITVTAKDDGGGSNGGEDTVTRNFTVIVSKQPELHVNSLSVNEGHSGLTEAVFEVELRGANSLPVTVRFSTADGTATAGGDYQPLSGELEFRPGTDGGAPRLAINRGGDYLEVRWTSANTWELFETDSLGSTVWRKSEHPANVLGNEHIVVMPVSRGTRFFRLASTAAASSDTTLQQVRVLVVGDQLVEPGENFFLRLSDPVNAIIVQGSGEALIRNDDSEQPNTAPQVRITSPETDDTFPDGTSIVIAAEAADLDGIVKRVDFFANGQLIGNATRAPFTTVWVNVSQGEYTLRAVATDDKQAVRESATVQISVRAADGRKRIAIVQNFSDPEIAKLQAWLADLDLNSRIFNQEGLTFEALQEYDLVLWDDLGTLTGGLSGNDVTVFQQVHDAGMPLYFIGNDLARASTSLSANLATVWTGLLHLKPTDTEVAGEQVTVSDQRHPVINGPFGLIGGFKLASDSDVTVATGNGELVLARTGGADVLLAHEDAVTTAQTVTQNVLAFQGAGLAAGVQREKLFKNAIWWLLKLLPPPPFSNLGVTLTAPAGRTVVGQPFTLTAEVRHSGELEATGITLTVALPGGLEFVSAESEAGPCFFEDGVVVCLLGRLFQADVASAVITVRPTALGTATLEANVSANQPEAVPEDNSVELIVDVLP